MFLNEDLMQQIFNSLLSKVTRKNRTGHFFNYLESYTFLNCLSSSSRFFSLTRSWSGWHELSAGPSPGNSPVLCPGMLGQALGYGSGYPLTRPTKIKKKKTCEGNLNTHHHDKYWTQRKNEEMKKSDHYPERRRIKLISFIYSTATTIHWQQQNKNSFFWCDDTCGRGAECPC